MTLNFNKLMFSVLISFIFINSAFATIIHYPSGTSDVTIPNTKGVRYELLKNIAPLVQKSIAQGKYPGAVILASHRGHIIYRGVFGSRRILPDPAPMRFDTIFDLASLTKVVATTPAVMQLVEQGKLELDAPVNKYWPQFAMNGKSDVTIRELLTHTSGLPADIEITSSLQGEASILQKISQIKLNHPAGTNYLYSDLNFIVLAYLVERISHQPFAAYSKAHVFKLLGMTNTSFLPPQKWQDRIAPTEIIHHNLRWGVVQDPLAYAMNGVSGNAGLFSTAGDLGIYAQCLLNNGRLSLNKKNKKTSGYLLGPLTVLKMTTPQTSPALGDGMRSLGWDMDSAYSNRGVLFPVQSYGHTGWTGTSIWIDPITQTWIIVLTSRRHAVISENNQIVEDRRTIANIIAASIIDTPMRNQSNTGRAELSRAYPHAQLPSMIKEHG